MPDDFAINIVLTAVAVLSMVNAIRKRRFADWLPAGFFCCITLFLWLHYKILLHAGMGFSILWLLVALRAFSRTLSASVKSGANGNQNLPVSSEDCTEDDAASKADKGEQFRATMLAWIKDRRRNLPPGEWEAAQKREAEGRELQNDERQKVIAVEACWKAQAAQLRRAAKRPEKSVVFSLTDPMQLLERTGVEIVLPSGEYCGTLSLKDAAGKDEEEAGYLAAVKVSSALKLSDGTQFTAQSFFSLHDIAGIESLSEGDASKLSPTLRLWDEMDEVAICSLTNGCLLPPLKLMGDDGVCYELLIGGRKFTVQCKNLSWFATLALHPDGRNVICRIDRLTAQIFGQPDEGGEPAYHGDEEIPAFCFNLPPTKFLPIAPPGRHFRSRKLLDDIRAEEVEFDELKESDKFIRWERTVEATAPGSAGS